MKIATYNIWNCEAGMPYRTKCIISEIVKTKADILCIQEVHNKAKAEELADKAGYPYCFFENYRDSEEGLCILSNFPFVECEAWLDKVNAVYCSFLQNQRKVAVVNLHLPWDSVAEREKQIVNIITEIDRKQFDYVYMVGDFNCSDSSDVHRYLTGDCLLRDKEAKPCWYDLALAYAEVTNTKADFTLNFRENPRFKDNTVELNARYDRILLRNTYPCEFPVLRQCSVFGKTIYEDISLAASDHYGVVVEVCF